MTAQSQDGRGKICPRCHQPFKPRLHEVLVQYLGVEASMAKFCEDCEIRQLLDSGNLPTPPELLDPHSRNPALSDDAYQRKLRDWKTEDIDES